MNLPLGQILGAAIASQANLNVANANAGAMPYPQQQPTAYLPPQQPTAYLPPQQPTAYLPPQQPAIAYGMAQGPGSGSNGVPHEVDGQQAAVMMQPSGNFSPVTTVPPVMAFRPENPGVAPGNVYPTSKQTVTEQPRRGMSTTDEKLEMAGNTVECCGNFFEC